MKFNNYHNNNNKNNNNTRMFFTNSEHSYKKKNLFEAFLNNQLNQVNLSSNKYNSSDKNLYKKI